ncbi:4-carboxymuconolactone decarboxylase [Nocardia amikacinitolerans]|uniref:carboxymuconolactone decarboxylase family protein n=1 Tax=Nocardia amikacinitolerans TaxID=756689 RepID=UPI000832B133|nr:carboxymuconolactone decarboxylase family protein [Nocardia amikacinitolerans]MCP2320140.1 4-carboxymuconolactone decarboxylase [Nocardia amikacinitolerans]
MTGTDEQPGRDALTARQRAVYDAIVHGPRTTSPQHFQIADADGRLLGPFGLMVEVPETGEPLQALGAALRYRTSLTAREREIAILTVARCTASAFERYAHEAVGRAAGLTDDEIDGLRTGHFVAANDREAAVAALAACSADTSILTPDNRPENDVLARTAVIEVTVLAGYYRSLAQLMGLFSIGAPIQ